MYYFSSGTSLAITFGVALTLLFLGIGKTMIFYQNGSVTNLMGV
jgi:hypothetical protein